MITTRTPFRVSLFGGGTDYPAWYREYGGQVLSGSIDKYCYLSCRRLPPFFDYRFRVVYSRIETVPEISQIDHPAVRGILHWLQCEGGLDIHHMGDLPARSGLGSSSSFSVGLIHAMRAMAGQIVSKEQLAQDALHVEQQVVGECVGSQDQVAAAFGGFNHIRFLPGNGGFAVAPVILPAGRLQELESHLMLGFTGLSRIAEEVARDKVANLGSRAAELHRMSAMVDEALAILQGSGPIEEIGRLLHEGWEHKKRLSQRVSNRLVDDIYHRARQAGAIGGKLLGAGGGGFMLLFVRPEMQAAVRRALGEMVHVPFRFEQEGSRVIVYQPEAVWDEQPRIRREHEVLEAVD